ncbi:MAG: hypothetical protein KAR54_01255 [Candidatus Pacebacteria bacterium]|nr:hypothetical protein [Candidatus Paceibacterota bacterium]
MFEFKQLKEKFLSIPEDVRAAISSTDIAQKLQELGNEYSLQLDEIDKLFNEIGFVMLGLKKSSDFVKNIQNVSGLSYEKSKQLAEDINNSIFKDIRESLKEIHQQSDLEEDEDLDEDAVRKEIMSEIEKPTIKTTDIINIPQMNEKESTSTEAIVAKKDFNVIKTSSTEDSGVVKKENIVVDLPTEQTDEISLTKPSLAEAVIEKREQSAKSSIAKTTTDKQKQEKNTIIDPYREPIE